ncbi:Hypothetical predicted protein, partial [Pelobates cultripes]
MAWWTKPPQRLSPGDDQGPCQRRSPSLLTLASRMESGRVNLAKVTEEIHVWLHASEVRCKVRCAARIARRSLRLSQRRRRIRRQEVLSHRVLQPLQGFFPQLPIDPPIVRSDY